MKNTFRVVNFFFAMTFVFASSLLFTGCASKRRTTLKKSSTPRVARIGWKQQGIASWYGDPYHGRRAANGEIYDMEEFTAAHKTLPFETWVRVKNISNKKSTDVRITDRGPFIEGRIVDLSRAAAREIDLLAPGTSRVKLEVIRPPKRAANQELFAIQIGALNDEESAREFAKQAGRFGEVRIRVKPGSNPPVFRVLVGRESALNATRRLHTIRSVYGDAFLVRTD